MLAAWAVGSNPAASCCLFPVLRACGQHPSSNVLALQLVIKKLLTNCKITAVWLVAELMGFLWKTKVQRAFRQTHFGQDATRFDNSKALSPAWRVQTQERRRNFTLGQLVNGNNDVRLSNYNSCLNLNEYLWIIRFGDLWSSLWRGSVDGAAKLMPEIRWCCRKPLLAGNCTGCPISALQHLEPELPWHLLKIQEAKLQPL